MLLGRISPLSTLGQFGREMERLFGDYLPDIDASARRVRAFPPLNMWEDGEVYHIEAEVPGLNMENIDVEVLGNELTIKGRREQPVEENVTYHRRERGHGEFTRMLTLPTDVDVNQVEASLREGVLTVTLPKAPSARTRKVQIKAIE